MSYFCAIVADHRIVVTIPHDPGSICDKTTLSQGQDREMAEDIHQVIASLQAELKHLNDHRSAILTKILVVRQTIEGLAELFGPGVVDDELRQLLWPHRRVSRRVVESLCRRLLGSQRRPLQMGELLNLIESEYPGTFTYVKHPDKYLRSVLEHLVTVGEVGEERIEPDLLAWKAVSPAVECNTMDTKSLPVEP